MELSDFNKPETMVSFGIFSPELVPDNITENLKVQPDKTHQKGEYPRGNPRYSPYEDGMWMIDSRLSREEPFEAHLDNLLSILEEHGDFIFNISSHTEVRFYCVLIGQESFQLSSQIMHRISNIGAALGVTFEPLEILDNDADSI